MGFELIAVLNSTLCSMLGPGLALRGPDGSMHRAVDGLMLEYRLTFVFFSMGLVAFHLSALIFAWLEFSMPVALAMTMALLMFVYGMFRYAVRIYMRFALSTDPRIVRATHWSYARGTNVTSGETFKVWFGLRSAVIEEISADGRARPPQTGHRCASSRRRRSRGRSSWSNKKHARVAFRARLVFKA